MTNLDLESLSLAELAVLVDQVSDRYQQLIVQQQTEADESRYRIAQAIASMEALLGAPEGVPSTDSIRGVLRYSDADMADNAGIAFRLAFIGLEELTKAVIDAARILAK